MTNGTSGIHTLHSCGWLVAYLLVPGAAWAAGDRGGDVDQRYPKDALIQNGGPVYDVTQPPDGQRSAKGDGLADDTEDRREEMRWRRASPGENRATRTCSSCRSTWPGSRAQAQ